MFRENRCSWNSVQSYLFDIHNIRLRFKNTIYKAKKLKKKEKNQMFSTN